MADHRGPGAVLPVVVARALQRYLVEQEALVRDMWKLFEAPIDMAADGGRESTAVRATATTTMKEVLERVVDNLDTDYCLVRGNREFFESVSAASFAADHEQPPQRQLMPPPPSPPPPPPPEWPSRSVLRQRRPAAVGPQLPVKRRRRQQRRLVTQPLPDRRQHGTMPPPLSVQLLQQLGLQWVPPPLWFQHVQPQRLLGQQLHVAPSPVGPAAAMFDVPGCR